MIAGRAMAILTAVIDEYVDTCAPVGSKALVDHHHIAASAATVRSDLAGLERSGHLTHPHVSAGRVPTDLGYREVVGERLRHGISGEERLLAPARRARDLRSLSRSLASITRCLSVVSEPAAQAFEVASLSLTRISGGRVMLVVVMDDGHVASRSLACTLDRESLARVAEAASEVVVGSEIHRLEAPSTLSSEEQKLLLAVVEAALALVGGTREAAKERSGMAFLLAQPEFRDLGVVRVVADALEDADVSFDEGTFADDAGLMVSIGSENADERLRALSVVAKEYHSCSGVGYVACVGPTRMDYPLVIGAVLAGAERAQAIVGAQERG